MTNKDRDLSSILPDELIKLVRLIFSHGCKTSLVGGAIRDYFLEGKVSDDFDLELRPIRPTENILDQYKVLIKNLDQVYNTENLPYNMIRIDVEHLCFELTLPRIETYSCDFHHSNFDASFIADLDYSKGCKRRDFTINSMLYEYDGTSFHLIDPLDGKEDLDNRLLKPCSEDFDKDPCLLYTSPSPRDAHESRMPSSA